MKLATQIQRVCLRAPCWFLVNPVDLRGEDLNSERVRYVLCNLCLNSENVIEGPVVALSPNMPIGSHIDQLRRHPDSVARLSEATFQDGAGFKLATNLFDPFRC